MKHERCDPDAPKDPRTHLRRADFIAHAVLGVPVSCACPDCRQTVTLGERARAFPAETAIHLPPAFWARQESAIVSRIAGKARPQWTWALAPVAVLAMTFILAPAVKHTAQPTDPEKAYEEALEALDRPALGDLEACSLLFTEGDTTDKEESL